MIEVAYMERNQIMGRNYQMDNLKGILIIAVVLGHLLEQIMAGKPEFKFLYLVIYSFHMPLFAYTTGVFARFNPSKIKRNMIYPYLVFQTIYLVFSNRILQEEVDIQYTTPYWILWYLFAIIVWNLVLPLVKTDSLKKKLVWLGISFAAALVIGFDEKAGYFLSFSRIVQFFPYFLLGTYSKDLKEKAGNLVLTVQKHRLKIAVGVASMLGVWFIMALLADNVEEIKSIWFYGSCSYELGDYSWKFRLLYQTAALAWLGLFLAVIPFSRLPFLSRLGAHTMPVYVLHGFILKWIDKKEIMDGFVHPLLIVLVTTVVLVTVLSSKPVEWICRPFLKFPDINFSKFREWYSTGKNRSLKKRHSLAKPF